MRRLVGEADLLQSCKKLVGCCYSMGMDRSMRYQLELLNEVKLVFFKNKVEFETTKHNEQKRLHRLQAMQNSNKQ